MLCLASSSQHLRGGKSVDASQPPSVLYRYTRNLDAREVAALMLLERCRSTQSVLHLPPAHQLATLQPRVAMALRHSVAVVSAFAPLTLSAEQRLLEGSSNPTIVHGAPRRLVGLARAYGDASTVATMADVVVCSTLAGSAVAGILVKLLCERVWRNGSVSDLGTLAPPSVQGLLVSCSFGPDPEGSTAMALPRPACTETLLEAAYSPQHIAARHLDTCALARHLQSSCWGI